MSPQIRYAQRAVGAAANKSKNGFYGYIYLVSDYELENRIRPATRDEYLQTVAKLHRGNDLEGPISAMVNGELEWVVVFGEAEGAYQDAADQLANKAASKGERSLNERDQVYADNDGKGIPLHRRYETEVAAGRGVQLSELEPGDRCISSSGAIFSYCGYSGMSAIPHLIRFDGNYGLDARSEDWEKVVKL